MNARVLTAIDAGVRAGNVNAARAALRRGDWVARIRARRAFEARLLDAMVASAGAPPDPTLVHPMRVVALQERGLPCDPTDVAATERAYAAAGPPPTPSRVPVATLAVGVAIAALVAAAVWLAAAGGSAPRGRTSYTRPLPAPRADAFVAGGVPLADEGLATLLGDELPELVLAVDRGVGAAGPAPAPPASAWMKARGGALADAWTRFVAAYLAWGRDADASIEEQLALDRLQSALRAVNEQLAAAGLGYLLELDTPTMAGRLRAVVYSYRVERVTMLRGPGASQPALEVRRIDHLNVVHGAIGIESARLGTPLVLVDRIEDVVRDEILELVGDYGRFRMGDDHWQAHGDGVDATAKVAAAAIRDEMIAALGVDGPRARAVGSLLGERRRMLTTVDDRAAPTTLFLPAGTIDALPDHPSLSRRRLREIEALLARADAARIATLIEDQIIASTRIHEVQHALNTSEVRRYPPEVERRAGAEEIDERENLYGTRLNQEVSAYLAELASSPIPRLNLWWLARPAFDHVRPSAVQRDTALIVLAALADQLALPLGRPNDRRDLGALVTKLSATPVDALQAAAKRAWEAMYGLPLVTMTVAPS